MSDDTATTEEVTASTTRTLSDYEVKVFATALDAKNRNGWCDDGFNDAMSKLGLPTRPDRPSGENTITVTIPTTGAVTYRLGSNSNVTTLDEAMAAINSMIEADRRSVGRQGGLNYGSRGPVSFNVDKATVTGLPDGQDHRTDEQKAWDAAIAQVKALNDGDLDTSDEDDD